MIDRYTKVVLTVIAVAVSINALHSLNLVKPAIADGHGVTKVAICDPSSMQRCAKVLGGALIVGR